jgi:hypothetical protein
MSDIVQLIFDQELEAAKKRMVNQIREEIANNQRGDKVTTKTKNSEIEPKTLLRAFGMALQSLVAEEEQAELHAAYKKELKKLRRGDRVQQAALREKYRGLGLREFSAERKSDLLKQYQERLEREGLDPNNPKHFKRIVQIKHEFTKRGLVDW